MAITWIRIYLLYKKTGFEFVTLIQSQKINSLALDGRVSGRVKQILGASATKNSVMFRIIRLGWSFVEGENPQGVSVFPNK